MRCVFKSIFFLIYNVFPNTLQYFTTITKQKVQRVYEKLVKKKKNTDVPKSILHKNKLDYF